MGKITALRSGRGRTKLVKVYMDGKLALNLEPEVVVEEKLEVEQTLPVERIKALAAANNVRRCYNAAALFLSYRARSEPEIRERLNKRGFDTQSITAVLEKLKRQGLVDDAAFARSWKENRESFSPRSKWLTRRELKQKGIADDIIEDVVAAIDDEENAYRAALKKARSLSGADYESFRRRLGDHLKRRGFSYGVIASAVSRVWQETSDDSGE